MKYHENHQKRALGVIVAASSQNWCFLKGLAPTSKSMALAHLDPVAAFGRKTRGGCGSWCVCVWGCAGFEANGPGVCCVCVVDASKNMQGTGVEAKRIVPVALVYAILILVVFSVVLTHRHLHSLMC